MSNGLSFRELQDRTLHVINEFKKVERKSWRAEGAVMEMAKQVGELAKQVMRHEGYYMRGLPSADEKAIADELSDILFIAIRIADHYRIDLETEHLQQLEIALKSIEKAR